VPATERDAEEDTHHFHEASLVDVCERLKTTHSIYHRIMSTHLGHYQAGWQAQNWSDGQRIQEGPGLACDATTRAIAPGDGGTRGGIWLWWRCALAKNLMSF